MLIPCAEKCIYEKEGMCGLDTVIPPSNTPTKDCPYFEEKNKGCSSKPHP